MIVGTLIVAVLAFIATLGVAGRQVGPMELVLLYLVIAVAAAAVITRSVRSH